jgi:hypothetical protein
MARETVTAVRFSQPEKEKVEQLQKEKGFSSLAEVVRYCLDRVYTDEITRKPKQAR